MRRLAGGASCGMSVQFDDLLVVPAPALALPSDTPRESLHPRPWMDGWMSWVSLV